MPGSWPRRHPARGAGPVTAPRVGATRGRPFFGGRTAAGLGLTLLVTAGCSSPADPGSEHSPDHGASVGMQHVHGLGVNPTDGDSYVATHTGVFRVDEDRDPVRVADRFQDTMGFTVIGPDEFLGSGHPDLSERDLPTHLGLVSSSDAAETWRLESLAGRADFHALDAAAGRVVGYDALSETVLSSRDRTEWEQVAGGTVLDVAVDPSGVRVLATSPGGRLAELVDGAKRFLPAAPPAVLVDWPRPEELVTVDAEGQVQVSSDSGASWKKTGTPQGPPQAFDAGPGPWLLATEDDVLTSTDQGRTWSLVAPLH